jgi:hypothetical protein
VTSSPLVNSIGRPWGASICDEDDIDEWLEAEHDDDRPLPDCFWYQTVEHSAPAYWV